MPYPAELDEFIAPPDGSRLSDVIGGRDHRMAHADLGAAVMAIQAKLGTTDSADPASLDFRMRALEYVLPSVTAFTDTIGTVEVGTVVASVTLNWSINKTITSQSINQGIGSLDPALRTLGLTGLALTSDTTFTLTVGDGANTANRSTSVLFRHRRRWGVSATATPDAALIDALTGDEFSAARAQSRSMSPSAEYLYFAWPASWGTPTFTVNGLAVTGWAQTTISYTNPSGNTTSFDVWRSPYPISGTFAVVVT